MKFRSWLIPSCLALGALLAFVQPGNFLASLILFSFLFLLSFYVLRLASSWGNSRILHYLLPLAFLLRLALGVTLTLVLPVDGNPNEQHRAGYIFFDAYRRDAQAWDLARSNQPILSAFNKDFYTDQYGGLLALSAAAYRYLSPDAQRPLLPVLLGALTATLGLAFLWKAAAAKTAC